MRQITLREIHLKPENYGVNIDEVCKIADELYPSLGGSRTGSCLRGFSWIHPTQDKLNEIKGKLDRAGAIPTIVEREVNVIFPPEYTKYPQDAYDWTLDKLGEIELSDWLKSEEVDEAYRFVSRDAFYPVHGPLIVTRISPKQIVRVWDDYLGIFVVPETRGTLEQRQVLAGSSQKAIENQTWLAFRELLQNEGFWGDNEWRPQHGMFTTTTDGVEYLLEGWKNGTYKLRRAHNEPQFEKVGKFLGKLL
jgi:hypothetical protein